MSIQNNREINEIVKAYNIEIPKEKNTRFEKLQFVAEKISSILAQETTKIVSVSSLNLKQVRSDLSSINIKLALETMKSSSTPQQNRDQLLDAMDKLAKDSNYTLPDNVKSLDPKKLLEVSAEMLKEVYLRASRNWDQRNALMSNVSRIRAQIEEQIQGTEKPKSAEKPKITLPTNLKELSTRLKAKKEKRASFKPTLSPVPEDQDVRAIAQRKSFEEVTTLATPVGTPMILWMKLIQKPGEFIIRDSVSDGGLVKTSLAEDGTPINKKITVDNAASILEDSHFVRGAKEKVIEDALEQLQSMSVVKGTPMISWRTLLKDPGQFIIRDSASQGGLVKTYMKAGREINEKITTSNAIAIFKDPKLIRNAREALGQVG